MVTQSIDLDERELLLLGLLSREEMHGYGLTRFLEKSLGSLLPINRSTAYFLLDRLSQKGLVAPARRRQGRRPERRVYEITETGRSVFLEALRMNLRDHSAPVIPDAVGILFLDELPVAERVELLRSRLDRLGAEIDGARARLAAHASTSAAEMLSLQLAHVETDRDWIEGAIRRLQQPADRGIEKMEIESWR